MRVGRQGWWFVIGVAGLVVTAACGGGSSSGDEAGVVRPADRRPATEEAPTTSVPPRPTATTVAGEPVPPTLGATPPVTGVTVADPDAVDDPSPATDPYVTVTPTRGPVGTRVRLDGHGFTDAQWQRDGGALWLALAEGGCALYAEAEHDLRVTGDGHLSGTFVVPAKGICRYSTGQDVSIGAGRFHVNYQCTACRIGVFTVILPGESTEEPTGTECDQRVNFGGGENIAGDIFADGLTCTEAETFLRAHGGPLGPVNGAAHIDADGFSCDRTGQSDVHLPRANYKCTRGSETIWFVRT